MLVNNKSLRYHVHIYPRILWCIRHIIIYLIYSRGLHYTGAGALCIYTENAPELSFNQMIPFPASGTFHRLALRSEVLVAPLADLSCTILFTLIKYFTPFIFLHNILIPSYRIRYLKIIQKVISSSDSRTTLRKKSKLSF